ncbi:MAG: hypothetical protein EOM83_10350 [Clostridia bacterium]|nr:hypothetical protein [Clostridia bacterium]
MSFTIYKSSAGSGKTYTLVKEYLNLVMQRPEDYRHVLAITFTNKAAAEMKDRILHYLALMAYGAKNKKEEGLLAGLSAHYCELIQGDAAAVQARAQLVLGNILHDYSNFAIGTIDSFVQSIVRSFARELKLPAGFEVELNAKNLLHKSIDALLSKAGVEPELTSLLVSFIKTKMEDEKSWNIENEIFEFGKIMLREDSQLAADKLLHLSISDFRQIERQLSKHCASIETLIKSPATDAMQLLTQNGITSQMMYYGGSGVYSYFERIANGDFSKPELNKHVQKMLEIQKWQSGQCPPNKSMIIERLQNKLEGLLQISSSTIQDQLPHYNLHQLVLNHIYEMALLNEIEKVMQDFRDNENIVHISEFNKRIATIVQREPVPFIYERIGEKYRHFLIDEFQDTSVLQWHNMLPLLENSLASNYFNMIVGDGKQAIYRFRNGDVEQFAALPGLLHHDGDPIMLQRENLLRHHYKELELDTNYRSFREVVEFNNDFFDFAKQLVPENLQAIYHCSPQKVDEKKTGGSVDIHFLKFEKNETDTDVKEDKKQQWMAAIMKQVQKQLRTFQPGQIAILTRKNDQASDIAQHLTFNGISVVTSEALLLTSSPEVSFIIALLRFINDKTNKINIGEMLAFLFSRHPEKIVGFDQLLNLSIDINIQNPQGLSLSALLHRVFGYDTDFTKLASLSLTDLVHEVIRIFELSEGGRNDFIRFFIDIIIKYTATNPEGIPDFLHFWEEECQDKSIVVPETMQAVTVMTIHKAKGLQFPVVILPYADIKSKNNGEFLWVDPQFNQDIQLPVALVKTGNLLKESSHSEINEAESGKSKLDVLNVLYVAMTRPVNRLIVMMDSKAKEDGAWSISDKLLDGADIFYQYLESKGLWDKEKQQYHFGAEVSEDFKLEIKVPEKDEKTVERLHAGRWREKLSIRYRAPEYWEGAAPDRRRDRGIMMHHLLSQINTSADISIAVEQAAIQGLLAADEKEAIAKDMDQLVSNSTLAPFFAPGAEVITERDILLPDGHVLRPDRVVKIASGAAVIDYKTGKESPMHQQQMETYAAALRDMGMTEVVPWLVYLPSDERDDLQIIRSSDN